jgi:hypothetical protein
MKKVLPKFVFKIRIRSGVVLENLQIPAVSLKAAERNIKEMYLKCDILEVIQLEQSQVMNYEDVLDVIIKA